MRIIKFGLKVIASYLTMLMPRSEKIYIFGGWFGEKFADNTKYMFLYINQQPNVKAVWITKNPSVCEELNKEGFCAFMAGSVKGIWYQLRAKFFFLCVGFGDVTDFLIGNAVIINFWHGVPLKKVEYDNRFYEGLKKKRIRDAVLALPRRRCYVVSTSPFFTKAYQHTFHRDEKHIVEIGNPRNDLFFNQKKGNLRECFPNKKIIVYMPTHRRKGEQVIDCSAVFDLNALDHLCSENSCVFIIKKHFYHRNETPVTGFKHVIEITNPDIDPQELLLSADVLISDYSSSYIDYLLLNRPVLFYNYDLDDYLVNDREMYFPYQEVTPGPKVQTYLELEQELKNVLKGIDDWEGERQRVTNLFFGKKAQGAVCPTVYDMIQKGYFR